MRASWLILVPAPPGAASAGAADRGARRGPAAQGLEPPKSLAGVRKGTAGPAAGQPAGGNLESERTGWMMDAEAVDTTRSVLARAR
jgi:hypothetical protein